jgi:hypothetical protein
MDLPNELRLQITGHLDTVDLLSLVRVNRKFRAAAADCLYKVVQIPLSRYVQNGLAHPSPLLTFLSTIPRYGTPGSTVGDLDVEICNYKVPVQLPALGCKLWWQVAPSISVQIPECELVGTMLSFLLRLNILRIDLRAAHSFPYDPSTTSLQLLFGNNAHRVESSLQFVPGFFNLRTLDWSSLDLPAAILSLPHLKNLTVSAYCSLPASTTLKLTPNISNLIIKR